MLGGYGRRRLLTSLQPLNRVKDPEKVGSKGIYSTQRLTPMTPKTQCSSISFHFLFLSLLNYGIKLQIFQQINPLMKLQSSQISHFSKVLPLSTAALETSLNSQHRRLCGEKFRSKPLQQLFIFSAVSLHIVFLLSPTKSC